MIPARGVREAFDYWTRTHESRLLDDLVVNFYTPKDRPEDLVMVVVGLEAAQTTVGEMRDLRNRIVRICRRFDVGPFPIEARTLDSLIVVSGRRSTPTRATS